MNGRDFLFCMIGVFAMAIMPTILASCAAKTTGIDASTELIGPTGEIEAGNSSPVLQPVAGNDALAVAGPSGETAAVGTGAQVSQITTGNIALGGGWLAVPLAMFALRAARRRRLGIQRVYRCGVRAFASKEEFENRIRDEGIIWKGQAKQDAIGRVIARAVKRVTQK